MSNNRIQYVICNFPCASINVNDFQNVPFLTKSPVLWIWQMAPRWLSQNVAGWIDYNYTVVFSYGSDRKIVQAIWLLQIFV